MKKLWLAVLALALLFSSASAFAQEYAWDMLRPASDFANSIDLPVKVLVFLLALAIFIVSIFAYSKSKSKRILLVSIAFALFTLKWLVKIADIYLSPGSFLSDASENIFELGIMLSLLVALFYKKPFEQASRKSR